MRNPPPDVPVTDLPGENPHYLRAIADLGEQQEIVVHSDIFAANGMKLLAKGARVNQSQFERLVQHKLSVSIDWSLSLESAVDGKELSREASKILSRDIVLDQLLNRGGDARSVRHELSILKLPSLLETRLTVMRGTRPELFYHSLNTALIAFALAQLLKMPASVLPEVLLAALCHDMGELHTDPAILLAEHIITPEERRFVYVHPITGFVLLKEMKELPASVGKAVLQHHERLDGSGYPYHLKASQITQLSKILAVAEVVGAVIDRFEPSRIDMLLRASRVRFDPVIVNALRNLLRVPNPVTKHVFSGIDITTELGNLDSIFQGWRTLKPVLVSQTAPVNAPDSPMTFLFERMNGIGGLILQAGFDPEDVQGMMEIAGDDEHILEELRDIIGEIDWLLRDLANEIDRRAPPLNEKTNQMLSQWVILLRSQRLKSN
ncbi:MAG: HD domain-containing phosphohydrolase [Pseudomonadota bacterium]